MDIPSDKWQNYYTADQAHWKDAREIFRIVFLIFVGIVTTTLAAILFAAAMPNRFPVGTSPVINFLELAAIVITPFLPLIISCIGSVIIFRAVATYFKAFYNLPEDTNAGKLIQRRLFGIPPLPPPLDSIFHYPFVIARNGEIAEKDAYTKWLGGPAGLVIMDGTALYLERGNHFSRVVGPGIAFLEKHERIKEIFDLRPQAHTGNVEAWTKDGIKVGFQAKIICRIGDANGTVFTEDLDPSPLAKDEGIPGENTPIFPCDPLCVRKAAERNTTKRKIGKDGKEELYESCWLDGAWGTVQGTLANYISRHHLEELFVANSHNVTGQILSGEVREKLRDMLDHNLMKDIGVTLMDIQIENFTLEQLIHEKRVEKWMAQWQAKAEVRSAIADAEWTKAVENARAEAQRDLIVQIADGLSEANPETFADAVLLALSGILQESLGDPYAPAYLTDALEKIQELLRPETTEGENLRPRINDESAKQPTISYHPLKSQP